MYNSKVLSQRPIKAIKGDQGRKPSSLIAVLVLWDYYHYTNNAFRSNITQPTQPKALLHPEVGPETWWYVNLINKNGFFTLKTWTKNSLEVPRLKQVTIPSHYIDGTWSMNVEELESEKTYLKSL